MSINPTPRTTGEIDLAGMSPLDRNENDVVTADFIPDTSGAAMASPASMPDVGALLSQASESLKAVDGGVRKLVSEKPAVALIGAVAAGFVIGRLLSRG